MARKKNVIRVLIADDHPAVRDGIRVCLAEQKEIKVIGEAADGEETIRKTNELRPDILILDVVMPRVNGLDVARQLRRTAPETKIIALSIYETREYVVGMVRSGVRGYLSKTVSPSELVNAIKAVNNGKTFFTSSIAQILLNDYVKHAETIGEASRLSKREKEVLAQVVQGYTSREIARHFSISRRTVETHRLHIRKKLGLDYTADLIKYAIAEGIVPDESGSYT